MQSDWREPSIYRYNTQQQTLYRVSSQPPTFVDLVSRSFGFRAAGSANGVVFMASNPLVRSDESIFILAFDGETGEFIDGVQLEGYVNVRRFRNIRHPDGSEGLYFFAGSEMHSSSHPNHLLRWRGTKAQPFAGPGKGFEVVGDLGKAGSGVELVAYKKRLVLTTWGSETVAAGLYQSGSIPPGGFSAQSPASFSKIFDAADFDPDPVIARSWLIGALQVFDDDIYWGSMHPNGQGFMGLLMDRPWHLFNARDAVLKSHRATHLFRTKLFDDPNTAAHTELLYGNEHLWAYTQGQWQQRANLLGVKPRYGAAGFGNPLNDYTWTMVKYRGSLYVGTFDVTGGVKVLRDEMDCQLSCYVLRTLSEHINLAGQASGYDLYRFDSSSTPAVAVTLDGFGNPYSNGLRNAMVVGGAVFRYVVV